MSRVRVAAALLVAACASTPPTRAPQGPPPARLRGLDFSAALDVIRGRPTGLAGDVRVVNRGTEPETLVFADGCAVRLRAYDVQGERVAPVWDGPVVCPETPVALAIAPGDSARLPIPPTTARDILAGGLSDGRYRITIWLAPDDRVVEIEAGEIELEAR